jgi:hypothetical protein
MNTLTQWTIENCAISLVVNKMKACEMFTAYDITLLVRNEAGRDINVPHDKVKYAVHSCAPRMSIANYARSVVSLSNGEKPFVYHPIGSDPTLYRIPVAALPAPSQDVYIFDVTTKALQGVNA